MNLTTKTLFKTYAGISGASKDSLIESLIPQVSSQIARFLRRDLELTTYKSWVDGNGDNFLRLDNYPLVQVYQVSTGSFVAATITNTSSSVIRATVSFDGTNLTLTEISTSGVETITPLAVATYKTLSSLKTAVELVTGWSMNIISSSTHGNEPSAFLRPIYTQDAYDEAVADLYLPDRASAVKITSVQDAILELCWPVTVERDFRYAPTVPPAVDHGFPSGTANIFVWYRAGYALPTDDEAGNMPDGLSLIVHQILGDVLSSTKLNSNLQSESISGYSYSLRAASNGAVASAVENRKKDLAQWRRVTI